MKRFPQVIVCVLVLLVLLSVPSATFASSEDIKISGLDTQAIDNYINEVMQVMPIPGIAVVVVNEDQVIYLKGYGKAGLDGRQVTAQMPFLIGSVTKCYTAMGIMQLASQGKVDLNAPVKDYIPEFHTLDPTISEKITLSDLINHRSGFSRTDGGADKLYNPQFTTQDVLRSISQKNPSNPVGTGEYSNLNFILLGIIIERVSGKSYAQYIQQNIFDPLDMQNSFLSFEAAQADGMAHGYRIMFGLPVPYDDLYSPAMQSAGYVYSSAEDLAHFLIPYFNEGYYGDTQVLKPLRSDADAKRPGFLDIYLQWKRGSGVASLQMHEGGTNAANSAVYFDPGEKTGVVVLTNTRVNARAESASGAAVIASGLLRIAMGKSTLPFLDGGFHRFYLSFDLKAAGWVLLLLLELVSSIWLWPRWLRSKRSWLKGIFYAFLVLDVLAGAVLLVGIPILFGYSWGSILAQYNDGLTLDFVLGILLAVSALAKLTFLVKKGRKNTPQLEKGKTA